MEWKRFAWGCAIGVGIAIALTLGNTRLLKTLAPGANLVNFGPALVGTAIVVLELLAAAGSLVAAGVFSYRRRWKRAGFATAFGITLVSYYLAAILY